MITGVFLVGAEEAGKNQRSHWDGGRKAGDEEEEDEEEVY